MPHTDKRDHVCHLQKSLQHLAQQVEIKPNLKNLKASLTVVNPALSLLEQAISSWYVAKLISILKEVE